MGTWQGIMIFLDTFMVIVGHQNVQFKGIDENVGVIFEVLLQITLKKAFDEGFTEFNHVAIDGTIKKAYN